MFKALLKVWQEDSLLNSAIETAEKMFAESNKIVADCLNSFVNNENFELDVYKEDKRINRFEKDIRKKVLEHLTINPKQDVMASLILLGVVRDIERIGDYGKNYFELWQLYSKKFEGKYAERLIKAKTDFIKHSYLTEKIFINGDTKKANEIIDWYYQDLSPEINKIIEDIISDDINTKDAVVYSLFAKFLKRSAAHLANIASSVSNPFHKIGFRTRDSKEIEIKS